MPWTQTDTSFKKLSNKRVTTSIGKGLPEEKGASTLELYLPDIKTGLIPGTGFAGYGVSAYLFYHGPTAAFGQTLVVDTSVPNNLTWFATTGWGNTTTANNGSAGSEAQRLGDWVSDKYDAFGTVPGAGYEIKVYDRNNNLITKSDNSNWLFDYQTGILVFNNDATSIGTGISTSGPFKIVGWRYVGPKGIIPASFGGLGYTSYNLGDLIVGAGSSIIPFPVGSDGYILSADSSTASGLQWIPNTGGSGSGSGISLLNNLTSGIQYFATGTSGSEFNISSFGSTHTFNIPLAGTGSTGLISSLPQILGGIKTFSDGLISSSGATIYGNLVLPDNPLAALYGGTGYTNYTKGDLLVGAGNTFVKLSVGSYNQALLADNSTASGLKWGTISGGGGGSGLSLYITDIAPIVANIGDLWFNSETAILSVNYTDVDSTQWVEIGVNLAAIENISNVGIGISKLNNLGSSSQYFATGTSGSGFNITSSGSYHFFNLPIASTASTGLVSGLAQTFGGNKTFINGFISSAGATIYGTLYLPDNPLASIYGGTGYTNYNLGDLIVGAGSSTIKLAKGPDRYVLQSNPAFSSGLGWTNASGGVGVSTVPPSNPFAGDLWWNSGDGSLSVYYDDVDGDGYWVEIEHGPGTGTVVVGGGSGSTGLVSINGLTDFYQYLRIGTTGNEISVSSLGSTHTINIPLAGSGVSGLVSTGSQSFTGSKTFLSPIIGDLNGSSTTSGYATSSGTAITATYAHNAGYATTSGLATTSSYSFTSGYGITAGLASTATYSHQSGYAITSGSSGTANTATYSLQSGYATTSGFATTATYAYQSGYGLTSGFATTANYAHQSGYAITSGNASFATTANYSYQSGYGLTSGLATTSTYSHQSGYAITSGSSNTAGFASTATYAYQSGYAITSGSATTSTYSFASGSATTALNVSVNTTSSNLQHSLIFSSPGSGSGIALSSKSTVTFNPSTNILSTSGLAITASTASTSTSTGALIVSGGVGIGGTLNSSVISISSTFDILASNLTTSGISLNQVAHSVSASSYRTLKYTVQITSGSDYNAQELLLLHDGSSVYMTEYAQILAGSGLTLSTFDADINSGNVRLLVSPTNAVTTYNLSCTAMRI
jgi:hypothetical protein